MSHFPKCLRLNAILILLFFVLKIQVFGDKIEEIIYQDITGFRPCVTLLNATHQIGCTSKRKGNVGILHYVNSAENFTWLLHNGKHAPYIPLFDAELFTDDRLQQLVNADKISGALVMYSSNNSIHGTKRPSSGFSPDYPCPNENFGLYSDDKEYSCSKNGSNSITWNDKGSEMAYKDYGVPVFAITSASDVESLIECYRKHNEPGKKGDDPDYPLCGVQLSSFMYAAKDTPTCMRKTSAPSFTSSGFCDELGDKNVWGTLFRRNRPGISTSDVIMVTAKLDSTAFFHDISYGADNDVTGIVVLLAAAKALGDLKRNNTITDPDLTKNQKHIMFTFFQGEVWDYIGSSRMIYDMEKGKFPDSCYDNKDCKLAMMHLSNISYYLELNQVGLLDDNKLWAHSDPGAKSDVRSKITTMFDSLSNFSSSSGLSIGDPSASKPQPLPPASFQRFLKKDRTIPGLVITDHKAAYTNKFYNSRFDDFRNINIKTAKQLTSLATAVAKTLLQLAYNETIQANASEQLVNDLLYCFLVNQKCPLFRDVLSKTLSERLIEKAKPVPLARYVGPYKKQGGGTHGVTTLTKFLLSHFTGLHNQTNITCGKESANVFSYKESRTQTCIVANVYQSPAQSPAFELHDYDSTEYSTWTESRWERDIRVRMFIIADPAQEAITLAVGIVLTLFSLVVTVFMYRKAEQLFTPGDCMLVINNDMPQ